MLKKLTGPWEDKQVLKLHLFSIIFSLKDLKNDENIGLDEHDELAIVNCSVLGLKDASCCEHFKVQNYCEHKLLTNYRNCTTSNRIKLGQEAFDKWKLDENIPKAKSDFDEVKTELGNHVKFLEDATGLMQEYMSIVEFHIQQLKMCMEEEAGGH